MRICSRCGASLPDDAAFCTNCGLAQPAAPQPQPQPQPGPVGAMPGSGAGAPPAQPPVYGVNYGMPQPGPVDENALRSAGYGAFIGALSSQRMLVLNVLYSVFAVCMLLSVFTNSASNAGGVLGEFAVLGVQAAAFWWMYAEASRVSREGGAFATACLTMYRVFINIVYILLFILLGIFSVALIFFGGIYSYLPYSRFSSEMDSYFYLSGFIGSFSILIGVFCIAALAVCILEYIKLRKTLNALLCSARTGLPTAFVSQFLIVMSILSGVCACFSALVSLAGAFSSVSGFFLLVCSVLLAVYQFMLADGMKTYQRQCAALWQSFGLQPYMQ